MQKFRRNVLKRRNGKERKEKMIILSIDKQCDVARVMTLSEATNETIRSELKKLSSVEWDEQCTILDSLIHKHDMPFDKGYPIMVADFINIGAANEVDEATVFIAYMNWLSKQKDN